jgi:hypothetical protein
MKRKINAFYNFIIENKLSHKIKKALDISSESGSIEHCSTSHTEYNSNNLRQNVLIVLHLIWLFYKIISKLQLKQEK